MKQTCENRMVLSGTSEMLENFIIEMEIFPDKISYLESNIILFEFETTIAPPIELLEELTQKGFIVNCSFHIPYTNEIGFWTKTDGIEIFTYDFSNPEWYFDLPEDLVEEFDLDYLYKDWIESEKELDFE